MQQPDLVIRGGRTVVDGKLVLADVTIAGEQISDIGLGLPECAREIDARGKLVLPGGVDTHCHIEQISGAGLMNADTFETATRSAAFGGTTTVVSFAAQHPGKRIADVVRDYQVLAARGALIDHAFHLIVADISGENLSQDIPNLIAAGHRSLKIFTTYEKVKLDDLAILDQTGDRAPAGRRQDGAPIPCAVASADGRDRGAGTHVPVFRTDRSADHAVSCLDP